MEIRKKLAYQFIGIVAFILLFTRSRYLFFFFPGPKRGILRPAGKQSQTGRSNADRY